MQNRAEHYLTNITNYVNEEHKNQRIGDEKQQTDRQSDVVFTLKLSALMLLSKDLKNRPQAFEEFEISVSGNGPTA